MKIINSSLDELYRNKFSFVYQSAAEYCARSCAIRSTDKREHTLNLMRKYFRTHFNGFRETFESQNSPN
jgi:hypothetical protein